MVFKDSKYTRWYNQLIEQAKVRVLPRDVYTEKHHIIPQSLGGDNSIYNLVRLTAREHFVCHWLLTKMVDGAEQKKMAYACKMMMHSHGDGQQRYRITSSVYESLKQNLNTILKNRVFTDSWKEKLKVSAQRRAQNEGPEQKAIRRANRISGNKKRKGEKRPGQTGSNNHFYGKGFVGADNPFYGKTHTEETLKKLRVPKPKIKCKHCGSIVGGESNFKRWHGDNCKSAIGEQIA
jgi:hypothetical protein